LTYDCTAHSAVYDPASGTVRPLFIQTDTWCSSGQFDADGTLVQTGGDNDGFSKVTSCSSACPGYKPHRLLKLLLHLLRSMPQLSCCKRYIWVRRRSVAARMACLSFGIDQTSFFFKLHILILLNLRFLHVPADPNFHSVRSRW
jgi:hypothetical protein